MASKYIILGLVLAALIGCALAQVVPIAGTRDLSGGFYDHYTGQYSSAITGRVYNTAPAVAVAAAPAIAAAPLAAAHLAPAIATAPAFAAPAIAAAPVAWIRR